MPTSPQAGTSADRTDDDAASARIQIPPPTGAGLRAQVDLDPAARWITSKPPPKNVYRQATLGPPDPHLTTP
jgi:hypothetical protein